MRDSPRRKEEIELSQRNLYSLRPLRVFYLRALPTGPCGREIPLSNLSKGICEREIKYLFSFLAALATEQRSQRLCSQNTASVYFLCGLSGLCPKGPAGGKYFRIYNFVSHKRNRNTDDVDSAD